MSNSKTIVATISKRGEVSMDAQGFVGDECVAATKGFEEALNAITVTHDPKPEMYESSETTSKEANLNF